MVSPALASEPPAGDCFAIMPTATFSSYTESPACPTRPTFASALSACDGLIPVRSGTFTVAAGSLPLEMTRLIFVPLATMRPESGSWSMTTPFSTVLEYCSLTEPFLKNPDSSIALRASASVMLR